MIDYEKLGAFYLGKSFDMHAGEIRDDLVLYDSKDLTTHGVIVGMTGSGKTGLGVTLLEEAAIDGIPSIVIDPKGDMGNLMLNFPDLQPSDFRPWVEKDEAARKGMTQDEFAADRASLWERGLADWGQEPDRIRKLRDAADVAIYTPGSDAGLPLTVLKSLDAPPAAVLNSMDAMRERVSGAASGLCTLLDLDADPIRSREHILLSNILDHAWRAGKNLDMASLIYEIQSPPFQKIGIMDLDQIFPPEDRMQLAMTLNNVLASPGFSGWMQGEPLNIQRLLYTPEGKPRIAVLSIAHLSDQERMFFVTILLNEVIAWMRSQSGTSSLRALLYMDEVFGYLPPTANPPSKMPLLTLLKQARAFGLGLILATQNPVDLDYKALSNAGTWFLGRLQTERDKMRVLDGLEGASANAGVQFDRARMEQILSGVGSRVFLLNNVHEDEPCVFQTRWALSYLSGPMTREQIVRLMSDRKLAIPQTPVIPTATAAAAPVAPSTPAAATSVDPGLETRPPVLSSKIDQVYLPIDRNVPREAPIRYEPAIVGYGRVHFEDSKANVSESQTVFRYVTAAGRMRANPWPDAESLPLAANDLDRDPLPDEGFVELPSDLTKSAMYTKWKTALKDELYRNERVTLFHCPKLEKHSKCGQSEGDFRVELRQDAREMRDLEVEKIRAKYASKIEKQDESIMRAEHRVATEEEQASAAKQSAWVTTGTSILGALFGRKLASATSVSRAGSAMRAHSRASKQAADIKLAQEKLEAELEEKEELESELEQAIDQIKAEFDAETIEIEPYEIKPRKSDIDIENVALLWMPVRADIDEPAWSVLER
ncbi:MAG: ATP-binding protein [Planctomycetaceae bacterium]|nr:ATP-binding protein [Planctomycetaceae bacterium]